MSKIVMHVDAEGKETKEGEAGVHPTRRSFFCSKHLSKKTFSKKDLPIYHRALDTRTQSEGAQAFSGRGGARAARGI